MNLRIIKKNYSAHSEIWCIIDQLKSLMVAQRPNRQGSKTFIMIARNQKFSFYLNQKIPNFSKTREYRQFRRTIFLFIIYVLFLWKILKLSLCQTNKWYKKSHSYFECRTWKNRAQSCASCSILIFSQNYRIIIIDDSDKK